MEIKRHTPEEKNRILRKADTSTNGHFICREHQISEKTFYRWGAPSEARSTDMKWKPAGRSHRRRQFRMMKNNEAEQLEKENVRLMRIFVD